MYIPQKSGHVSHTIKNYVLGELKRYIRYNSLKLSFLKIRTLFFLRLRNRGFKKFWLRKQLATLKYEDRDKQMTEKRPDSSFSHSACQIVLEKEAENLKMKRSRLADTSTPTQTGQPYSQWNLTNQKEVCYPGITIKKFMFLLFSIKPKTLQMLSIRGYQGKTTSQASVNQQQRKPWQGKAWKKQNEEEER